MKNWQDEFAKMRFDDRYHLGLGDVRITVAQQDEIVKMQAVVEAAREVVGWHVLDWTEANVKELRLALEQLDTEAE